MKAGVKRPYLLLALTKFLRQNEVKYGLHDNRIIINGAGSFPNVMFMIQDNAPNRVDIYKIPLCGQSFSIEANNIYQVINQMMRFELLTRSHIEKLKFQEFDTVLIQNSPMKVSKMRKAS